MSISIHPFCIAATFAFLSSASATALGHTGSISFYKPLPIDASSKSNVKSAKMNDVLILNKDVVRHINSTSNQLLNVIAPPNSYDDFALLETKSLDFKSNLDFFSSVSHELGVCGGFAQVDANDLGRIQANLARQLQTQSKEKALPLTFQKNKSPHIERLLPKISPIEIQDGINFISKFPTRLARNSNNSEIESIKNYFLQSLPQTNIPFTVNLISHRRISQKSIHIQIQGKNPHRHIVIGGHIDSINTSWGGSQLAPGADDNASGSSAVLQVLKTILQDNYIPQNTLNFFWYAGEELGLIGSSEIAKNFAAQKTDVIAALQLDMLGVPDLNHNIYLEQDFSSVKLNQLIKQVATTYLPHLKIKNTSCGYPCSDHSSWYQENYPVVFPTSGDPRSSGFNRRIHTTKDTPDSISPEYAANVTKLSLAFILAADQEL